MIWGDIRLCTFLIRFENFVLENFNRFFFQEILVSIAAELSCYVKSIKGFRVCSVCYRCCSCFFLGESFFYPDIPDGFFLFFCRVHASE